MIVDTVGFPFSRKRGGILLSRGRRWRRVEEVRKYYGVRDRMRAGSPAGAEGSCNCHKISGV